jgi:hypothetical protein
MPHRSVPDVANTPQPLLRTDDRPAKHDLPVVPETTLEVRRQIRESLGLPSRPEAQPTVPVEGHVCDFPLWSYSQWFRQKSGSDSAVSSEFVIAGMIFHHSRVKSELLHK